MATVVASQDYSRILHTHTHIYIWGIFSLHLYLNSLNKYISLEEMCAGKFSSGKFYAFNR